MESWGLVVHDEQTFLAKVVNLGIDEGILTADRVDEIIRISVAMANKYVLKKEIDFRSQEELTRVQETIIKLVGIGLEIKSKGDLEEGTHFLIEASPVDLFRLAYTRIEKLRDRWKQLLLDHRVEILIRSREYQALSELTRHQLAEMSVLSEGELYTIGSLTMEDDLFTGLAILEYYESELERYELILGMREILPFGLLSRSPSLNVENLSEVDSIREALINTLIISATVEGEYPVTVSMRELRKFLSILDFSGEGDVFPQQIEDVVIDLIHELAEGLDEQRAALFAKEMVETARKLIETIINEWDAVNSSSDITFFKRWTRIAILADAPDPIEQILTSGEKVDDFDFEILVEKLAGLEEKEVITLVDRMPWHEMTPEQVIGLFDRLPYYQKQLAERASLIGFTAENMVDLLESVDTDVIALLTLALRDALAEASFTLDELELLVGPPHSELLSLLWKANPPTDMDKNRALFEFKDGSNLRRGVLLSSCVRADFFPELFAEAWDTDPALVKRVARSLPTEDVGPLLLAAGCGCKPEIGAAGTDKVGSLDFKSKSVNNFFRSLPGVKKRAAVQFFTDSVEV